MLALKALLPYYAGKVKCIYIDPPYNTGNEGWVYNDAVNSPEIRRWLGQVVGPEAQDLSRHDKWLCMMYPRLALLREFLSDDGALFVSIDDNEIGCLRLLLDEIFGKANFVATIIWQKVYSPKNSAKHFSEDHDYIAVYARNAPTWRPNLLSRSERQDKAYRNPDRDPRGPWKPSGLDARNPYSKGIYPITCPGGRTIDGPPGGSYWRFSFEKFKELDRDGRIWWGKDGNATPQLKRFLTAVKKGLVPQTLWRYEDVGHTQEAKQELIGICDFDGPADVFISPKPTRLLNRIIELAGSETCLVMDSFAGSGTTGHSVLGLNNRDGGRRKFVLIEIDERVAETVARQRLSRAIDGYAEKRPGGVSREVDGLGGGFRYCTLGEPLFDEVGNIRKTVTFPELAAHVFFTETGAPVPQPVEASSPFLGAYGGKAVYLLFNGVLGDRRPASGNVLTGDVLRQLPAFDGVRVVYGEGCRLGADRLRQEGVVFRQIPYEIKVS